MQKEKRKKILAANCAGYRQSASQPYSDDFYLTLIDHTLITTQGMRKNPCERRSFGE